jgi:hypothetical protein
MHGAAVIKNQAGIFPGCSSQSAASACSQRISLFVGRA